MSRVRILVFIFSYGLFQSGNAQFKETTFGVVPVNIAMLLASSYQGSVLIKTNPKRDFLEIGIIQGLSNDFYSVGGENGFFTRYRFNLSRDDNVVFASNAFLAPYFEHIGNNNGFADPDHYTRITFGLVFLANKDFSDLIFAEFLLGLGLARHTWDNSQFRGLIGLQMGFKL